MSGLRVLGICLGNLFRFLINFIVYNKTLKINFITDSGLSLLKYSSLKYSLTTSFENDRHEDSLFFSLDLVTNRFYHLLIVLSFSEKQFPSNRQMKSVNLLLKKWSILYADIILFIATLVSNIV